MGLYDFTFYDLIARNARTFGEKVCWHEVDDGRELSFITYKEQVDRLATGLAAAGIQKGDRIGVVGKNSVEFFLLYGAAARLGAIMLPINWRLSSDEMLYNLNDCTAKLLFLDEEFQTQLGERTGEIPTLTGCFNLKNDQGSKTSFAGLLEKGTNLEPIEVSSDDGFVIIHTAAVAGRPRGALVSHTNINSADITFHSRMGICGTDVNLGLLPLFHVAGLFMATAAFHTGGKTVNFSRFSADQAVAFIGEGNGTFLFDFPPILDSIVKAAQAGQANIKALRAVVGLGTPEVIKQYHELTGGDYYAMYGQTETSCLATLGKVSDCPGSAGSAVPLGLVELHNDYGKPVAVGEVGEICMRGPMIFKGYWNLEEDNAYTFRDGWHHTGDLGRFDANGFLFYAGRKAEKELIKPGGENVYPAEVEKVILEHPAVAKTVVIGVPDPKWKEGIKAVCQLQPGHSLEARELIQFVGSRIASFKKPQYVDFVDELPTKEDGSIDRQEVKKQHGGS